MPAILLAILSAFAVKFVMQLVLSLGMAFVTYVGYQKGLDYLKSITLDAVNSLPAALYQILMIAGVGTGLGYIFGALSFYVTFKATGRLTFAFWGEK